MSIHESMFQFMKQYPDIDKLFSFNCHEVELNSSAFRVVDEEAVKKDIFGDETILYKFSIAENKGYTTDPFSMENIDNLNEIDNFIEWVKEQDRQQNFPNLGEGYNIESIDAVRTGSGIASVFPNGQIAQYAFTTIVKYTKKGKEKNGKIRINRNSQREW